jgi:CRISPR-associated protein Csd1
MSLNNDCREPGYLLGRMFAVVERTQEHANPGINATVRDRYYGSASAAPAGVFPILLRLNQHHLSKLRGEKPGLAVNMEKLNCEIIDEMPERFPRRLGLEQQGMFALGYYHQRNALFRKKGDSAGREE